MLVGGKMAQREKTLAMHVWRSAFHPQDPGEGKREAQTLQNRALTATLVIPAPRHTQ